MENKEQQEGKCKQPLSRFQSVVFGLLVFAITGVSCYYVLSVKDRRNLEYKVGQLQEKVESAQIDIVAIREKIDIQTKFDVLIEKIGDMKRELEEMKEK